MVIILPAFDFYHFLKPKQSWDHQFPNPNISVRKIRLVLPLVLPKPYGRFWKKGQSLAWEIILFLRTWLSVLLMNPMTPRSSQCGCTCFDFVNSITPKNTIWNRKWCINFHVDGWSLWRPLALKSISWETVLLNRQHIFSLLFSIFF